MATRDSVEFLEFWLVERDQKDISAEAVAVKLYRSGDATETWLPCTFIETGTDPKTGKPGTHWRTTTVVTYSIANYPEGSYHAQAKVTDSPEIPRVNLGTLIL